MARKLYGYFAMDTLSILSQFDRLVGSGLVFYDDQQENIEQVDGELKFQFLITSALLKKPTLQTAQPQEQLNQPELREGSDISTVGFEIGNQIGTGTHFLAANKFSFARPHLLLLTSDGNRRQYEALDADDIEAAWAVLATLGQDYAVFFNCGRDGGCSRLHKHMQVMPMPKESFASFLDSDDGKEPAVPFCWFYHRFESHGQFTTPVDVVKMYVDLLEQATAVGAGRSQHPIAPGAACPHNMVLTRRWMVVIPRRQAAINKEAGANAMGMLGVIAVGTRKEMDGWVRLGLTDGLRLLGVPV